jgi:sterol desaturase/sphingolipid hydroxylase (fatty acid hydroxylase superfamily)
LAFWLAITAVVLLSLIEVRFAARRDPAQRRLNIAVWLTGLLPAFFVSPAVSAAAIGLGRSLHVPSLGVHAWPLAASAVVYVLAMDAGEYLFHRAQHVVPFLWRMHSLHHSDPCVNATTTARHWWGDTVLKAATIWPLVAILLQPSAADIAIYAAVSVYNYFTHANLPVNFGRLSWLVNSPAYHRLHHSRAPQDHGANFAALFPIYDVLLGSYRRPAGFAQTGYEAQPSTVLDTVFWPARVDARIAR